MSVKVMGWVWDRDIPRDKKYLLLAYADHADHDGGNIFPSVDTMAKKTGYSSRSVQRITKKLLDEGWLIEDGESKHKTNKYRIPLEGGDKMTPPDKIDIEGCQNDGDGVTNCQGGGDIAVSPDSSFNLLEQPSLEQPSLDSIVDEMLLLWKELFPNKPQPRSTTKYVKEKVKARIKDQHFVDNWQEALLRASESSTLQSESWFSFKFFVANDENYQKCLDRWMAWKDEQKGNGKNNSRFPSADKAGQGWTSSDREIDTEAEGKYICPECWCTPCICGKVQAVQGDEYETMLVYNHMLGENQKYHFVVPVAEV